MANHVTSASPMSDLSSINPCAFVLDKEMCWILDTGATNRMVYSADLLTIKSHVTNRAVHLRNRAIVLSHI